MGDRKLSPKISSIVSENMLDIALGMYAYTYPRVDEVSIEACIPRPHGFSVYEIVNGVGLENINIDNIDISIPTRCDNGYVYVVEKIGLDTYIVCELLKRILACSICEFLGFKDTEAVVRQVVMLKGCKNLYKKVEKKIGNGMFKAVFWYCGTTIMHQGNKFFIKLIIDKDHKEAFMRRLELVARHGYRFLNYFGYQRFGTRNPITHILGKLLIKNEWDEFINKLCESRTRYLIGTPEHRACNAWESTDNAIVAIKTIPRRYLLLYVNAYQSYLFNVILSKLWLRLVDMYDFDKALNILEEEYRYLPIIGSRMNSYYKEAIESIINEILDVEEIKVSHFKINVLKLEAVGDTRKSVEQSYNVLAQVSSDNIKLSFVLNRGCYATIFLRELLRIDPNMYV